MPVCARIRPGTSGAVRIAITGATGNVGTSVIDSLLGEERVESIVGIARRRPEWSPPKVEWVEADVAADELEPVLHGADVVIHLAWAIQPSRDEIATRSTNVHGSERVFAAVAAAGVPALIYASSVGAHSPREPGASPVGEGWAVDGIPTSFYSRHKAEVEARLDRFEGTNPEIRVVRLRPALIFKGDAGAEIRRLFGGPLVPNRLLDPDRLPVIPWIAGLRTQAVHSRDVGDAYRLAALGEAAGAFNLAAEPVLDKNSVGRELGARVVPLPYRLVRALATASWALNLQPSPPGWVDMGMRSPLMDTSRARDVLGWTPRHSAGSAIAELLRGLAGSDGLPTPPLEPRAGGRARVREFLTGIGGRD